MTILPTHTCFDDALDFLALAVKADPHVASREYKLVHAICVHPDTGELFSHAWVEHLKDVVIQQGLVDGKRIVFSTKRKEHYAKLKVQLATVYSVEEAWAKNAETYHYGPWEPTIRELCRDVKASRVGIHAK